MKPILEYPNYNVTSDGKVWNNKYKRFLKPTTGTDGYLQITLCEAGRQKNCKIHRLVLEAFVGPCPINQECRHLNGNPADNRLENLKWGTCSENIADAIKHGTHCCLNNTGEKHGRAKLTERKVRQIRMLYTTGDFTQRELGRMFGVAGASINSIVHRKNWKHL